MPPDYLNMQMLELLNVVTFSGQTPTKLDGSGNLVTTQLLLAIAQLGCFSVNLFSADAALAPGHAGLVLVDCSAGNVTLTLPLASAGFWQYEFVRVDTTANVGTVRVQGGSSDILAPSVVPAAITSLTLLPCYDAVNVRSRGGGAWQVLRRNDSPWTLYAAGSAGTITVPSGYMGIEAECVGGGGGAAGGNAAFAAGGGGAGGTAHGAIRGTEAGAVWTYSVGLGGSGGASGASGSAGGATTITGGFPNPQGILTLTANGGAGGTFGPAPAGGDGGAATGTDVNGDYAAGGAGGDGYPSGVFMGGNGGSSAKGGGGRASTAASAVQTGHAPGSGGGAGYNGPVAGGNGQGGQLRVRFIR